MFFYLNKKVALLSVLKLLLALALSFVSIKITPIYATSTKKGINNNKVSNPIIITEKDLYKFYQKNHNKYLDLFILSSTKINYLDTSSFDIATNYFYHFPNKYPLFNSDKLAMSLTDDEGGVFADKNEDDESQKTQDEILTDNDISLDRHYSNKGSSLLQSVKNYTDTDLYIFTNSRNSLVEFGVGRIGLFSDYALSYSYNILGKKKPNNLAYLEKSNSLLASKNKSKSKLLSTKHIARLVASIGYSNKKINRQGIDLRYKVKFSSVNLNVDLRYYPKYMPIYIFTGLAVHYHKNSATNIYVYSEDVSDISQDFNSALYSTKLGLAAFYVFDDFYMSINVFSFGYAKQFYKSNNDINEKFFDHYSNYISGLYIIPPLNITIGYVF